MSAQYPERHKTDSFTPTAFYSPLAPSSQFHPKFCFSIIFSLSWNHFYLLGRFAFDPASTVFHFCSILQFALCFVPTNWFLPHQIFSFPFNPTQETSQINFASTQFNPRIHQKHPILHLYSNNQHRQVWFLQRDLCFGIFYQNLQFLSDHDETLGEHGLWQYLTNPIKKSIIQLLFITYHPPDQRLYISRFCSCCIWLLLFFRHFLSNRSETLIGPRLSLSNTNPIKKSNSHHRYTIQCPRHMNILKSNFQTNRPQNNPASSILVQSS